MNKKQSGIIVTLVVLIVFAGYLATKVNGPLYVNDTNFNDEQSAISLKQTKSTSTSTFFAEGKLSRDQETARTLQTIKSLMDDANTPKDQKATAADQYLSISIAAQNEADIELSLKAQGFEDSLCSIVDNKAEIFIKSDKKVLSKDQLRGIQQVVMSKAKLENIDVKVKE